MQFFWFLPRHGDCRYLGTSHRARTVTLDRFSNGRLINTVSGDGPNEQHGDGSFLTHAERHEVTHEFLKIWRGVAAGEAVNFSGEHLKVENAKTLYPPVQKPCPPLCFSRSSNEAIELAGEQVDVYLTWGDPPAAVADKIAKARASAARHGRTLRFGMRLHVIVRETSDAAWKAADELISHVTDEVVASAQQVFARFDSLGQQRMAALHGGRRDKLEVSPNLWAGVGLVRGGAGTALVGSPQEVADRIKEYKALGVDTFIFSGYPHLEEAYRLAKLLFPLLPLQNVRPAGQANLTGPFGEVIANDIVPPASKAPRQGAPA